MPTAIRQNGQHPLCYTCDQIPGHYSKDDTIVQHRNCRLLILTCSLVLYSWINGKNASAQVPPLPLPKAIQATELPSGAWGCWSRAHAGPCYLAQRFPMQLFSFPIIVGQERYETIMASNLPASAGVKIGKSSPAFRSVVLRRRALGLSPVVAEADDQIPYLIAQPSGIPLLAEDQTFGSRPY